MVLTVFVWAAIGFLLGLALRSGSGFLVLPAAGLALAGATIGFRLGALMALAAVSFVNPAFFPILLEVSEFSLRVQDVLFAIMILSWICEGAVVGRLPSVPAATKYLLAPVWVLSAYIGLTIITVYDRFPTLAPAALAAYARLVQYTLLVPIVVLTLRDRRAIRIFVKMFAVLGAASVFVAVIQTFGGGEVRARAGGLLGPNSLGLASGLMCLLGVILWSNRPSRHREAAWLYVALGAVGLVMTKSMGSVLSSVAAIGLSHLGRSRKDLLVVVRWVLVAVVVLIVLATTMAVLRPGDLQGLAKGGGGSFLHRAIVGVAGFGIFLRNPVLGAGWQASSFPPVIGAPDLNQWARAVFPSAPREYFPDVWPTSVHNVYVQVLAELGLVGALLAGWMAWRISRISRAILRGLPEGSLRSSAAFFTFAVCLVAIWWNTSSLYGGQIETFLFFSFLGALAAISRFTPDWLEEAPGESSQQPTTEASNAVISD